MENQTESLPPNVRNILNDFIETAKTACGPNLISVVLYGSAAEDRLRPSSDVNLILLLKEFEPSQINPLREKLRLAYAAIRLQVMFLLQSEIQLASESFAVKFTDILNRHRILFGADAFSNLLVSRTATLQRLKQVTINLTLRLRDRYALVSLREEQLVSVIAEAAGPIRACAAAIIALESGKKEAPKEALQIWIQKFPQKDWAQVLKNMSLAREEQLLKPGEGISTLLGLMDLLNTMQSHLQSLA